MTGGLLEVPSLAFLHITEVAAYCAKYQADYYRRFMRFQDVAHWPQQNDFVLRQLWGEFQRIAEANPLWRKGRQLIQLYGFWHVGGDPEHWGVDPHGLIRNLELPFSPVGERYLTREERLDDFLNSRPTCRDLFAHVQ